MLNLPRYTFLIGPNTPQKRELAELIFASNRDIVPLALHERITNAWDAILGRAKTQAPYPVDWEPKLTEFLRKELGNSALGDLLYRELDESGELDLHYHYLIYDVISTLDLNMWLKNILNRNILLIHTRLSGIRISGPQSIWLATDKPTEQLAQIERETSQYEEPQHESQSNVGNPAPGQ